ncbi:MAG: FMN-binding protein [Myxococcales bacterium]|nr:MAG: FMN-binding protein [Myxococcales bacterium]
MRVSWPILLIAVALVSAAAGKVHRLAREAEHRPTDEMLLAAVPGGAGLGEASGDVACRPVLDAAGELGCAAETDRLDPVVRGFGGEMDFLVGIAKDGAIASVRPLAHRESPAYWRAAAAEGYFERLVGLNAADDGAGIDAVSGATVTCEAAKQDILAAAKLVARRRYGLDVAAPPSPPRFDLDPLHLALFAAALALGLASFYSRRAALRWAAYGASIAVFGFALNVSAALPQVVDLLDLTLPGGRKLEPLLLFAVALGFALFGKGVYCARLCPFGALQEVSYRLVPWRLSPSAGLLRRLERIRWALLFAAVALAAGFGWEWAATIEPFGAPFTTTTPWPLAAFAGAALVSGALWRRAWCRLFCPTGACLELALPARAHATRRTGAKAPDLFEVDDEPRVA